MTEDVFATKNIDDWQPWERGWYLRTATINGRPSAAVWNGKYGKECERHAVLGPGSLYEVLRRFTCD